MATTPLTSRSVRRRIIPSPGFVPPPGPPPSELAPRRIASNFAALSLAEILCRGISVGVMLSLTKRLEPAGYGQIAFAFNVVFWLVLLVRDGVEVIAARELARHPRLIRPLVNHVLAVKGVLATVLFAGLVAVGSLTLSDSIDRTILSLYGLMLLTTAMGLDFVYRGTERMGLVAVSLSIRTLIYAIGVWYWVTDASRIVWVPALLALGEVCGIALVWACYIRKYGIPRPVLGGRFLRVFLRRGRSVCLIQVSQTVIGSADFMVVGLTSQWDDVGRYGAPHQMITAVLTFGLIFQQVVFPTLARSWRKTAASGRHALNALVQVLVAGLIPVAVGGTILAGPLVRFLPEKYAGAGFLLALGIWKAPLLNLAYLYQTTLIAVNREAAGVRLLLAGAIGSGPMAALFFWYFGLAGATAAVLIIALGLVVAGYGCLAREGRQPAWHHHLALPVVASVAMIPVCLLLQPVHVLAAIAGGILTYVPVLAALGGFPHESLCAIFHRARTRG
jgi:O-antigen/teichoic acid export membrane protein